MVCCFCCAIGAVILYGCYRYLLDLRFKLPPGPLPLPFFGNLYMFGPSVKSWVALRDLAKRYGDIFTFYIGQYRMVVLNSPTAIHEGIINQSKALNSKPLFLPSFVGLKPGILLASGNEWQNRRRFYLRAMRDFGMGKMAIIDRLHDEISHLLAEMEQNVDQPFQPHQLIANAVSNIICAIVFGKRFEYGDKQFQLLKAYLDKGASQQFSKDAPYFMVPALRHIITPTPAAVSEKVTAIVAEIVKECLAEHRKDIDVENIRDFPDLFIQAELQGEGVDLDGFIRVMVDMFVAGTETTATAIIWTLLYLTKHPEIQKRCHEEIDNVIGTSRLPTLADRAELKYIDAVMCEVLRIVTILPMALLHANLDEKIEISGFDIPPETIVGYNVWALHHDKEYWKNPEEFDPERWLDTDGRLLTHSSRFMVFGTGPRTCLGELLARVEYFEFVVSILQRFSFTLVDKNVSFDDGVAGITHGPPQFRVTAVKR